MCKIELKNDDKQNKKPYYEIQDIFNKYADEYKLNRKFYR